jgi:hypothetical protein
MKQPREGDIPLVEIDVELHLASVDRDVAEAIRASARSAADRLRDELSCGDDAQISAADPYHVTRMQLPATPELGLAVHNDLAARDQTLGICAVRDDPGELEQLAKTDHVAGDLNLLLHPGSVPGFVARSGGTSRVVNPVCCQIGR